MNILLPFLLYQSCRSLLYGLADYVPTSLIHNSSWIAVR